MKSEEFSGKAFSLLADSGSTKTEWCLAAGGSAFRRWETSGINPFFQSEAGLRRSLRVSVCPRLPGASLRSVRFYGAGCIGEKAVCLRRLLEQELQPSGEVCVDTDMAGAARALCGRSPGIACILGTGSNSCFYDGEKIVANVPPLGFILGDEGSGAVLGKLLVGEVLKGRWPASLSEAFYAWAGMRQADIIDRVYRQPFPNRFLAGFAPFLLQHISEPLVSGLVEGSFRAFFQRNVMQYDYVRYPAHFTGSVAFYFRPQLEAAAQAAGVRVGNVVRRPMERLVGSD